MQPINDKGSLVERVGGSFGWRFGVGGSAAITSVVYVANNQDMEVATRSLIFALATYLVCLGINSLGERGHREMIRRDLAESERNRIAAEASRDYYRKRLIALQEEFDEHRDRELEKDRRWYWKVSLIYEKLSPDAKKELPPLNKITNGWPEEV